MNLSLLYTAKGTSAFLVPVANLIKASTGSWHMVFVVTALMNDQTAWTYSEVEEPVRRQRGHADLAAAFAPAYSPDIS